MAMCLTALMAAGCCWGVKTPALPADYFTTEPGLTLSGAAEPEAQYPAVLPPVTDLEAHGRLTAGSFFLRGRTYCDLDLLARPSQKKLRLSVRREPAKLFTLTTDGHTLAIVIGRDVFSGEIPPEGSPLKAAAGVEAHEALKIFTLPARAADGDFERRRRLGGGWRLVPADPAADGLQWIEIDAESGLPAGACWERPDSRWWWRADRWRIEIEGWERYDDPEGVVKSALMPSEIVIRRRRGALRLDFKAASYLFVEPIPARAFAAPTRSGMNRAPLGALGAALEAGL